MDPIKAFSQYGNTPIIPYYVFFIVALILIAAVALFIFKKIAQTKLELVAEYNRFKNYATETTD